MTIKIISLLLVFSSLTVSADDLPAEYLPYKDNIGDWHGEVKLTLINGKGESTIHKYKKTSSVKYDKKYNAIVTLDTEFSPWTQKAVVYRGLIKWDSKSKLYKALVWSDEGDVRQFSVSYKNDIFKFTQLDLMKGFTFSSTVKMSGQDKIAEEGEQSFPSGNVKWLSNYTRIKN